MSTNYKYRSLKVYSSNEWLFETKKYRQVFDSNEVKHVYAELAFFNKRFDEGEWTARINLKAFSTKTARVELCNIHATRIVKPEDNIVYVREGWGQEASGSYWKEGEYCWEAYIDDELVATTYFYLYDVGVVTPYENKYFFIADACLYEGPDSNLNIDERKYLVEFDAKETRFVWVETEIENMLEKDWMCELTFNFYNDARQLKGNSIRMARIPKGESYMFETGWGSDVKGSWFEDNYTVEVVFMDTLIAVIPFKMGQKNMEGESNLMTIGSEMFNNMTSLPMGMEEEVDTKSLDELIKEMDGLTGLENVKQEVKDYVQYLNFLMLRKEKGYEDTTGLSLHSAFLGNPGTGKTTVARLLGKIFHKMGLLSKGHIHEVDRADLVAEYIGQTAPKVKEAIDAARGGILFIDEAYALYRSGEDSKDFGREVIEIILKEMSDGRGDIAIFVAGYPKEMEVFLDSNPGLKSRFSHYYNFNDYTPQELEEIASSEFNKNKLNLLPEAKALLSKKLVDAYRSRTNSFGNARMVISIVNEAKMNMGIRLMKNENVKDLPAELFSEITEADIKEVFEDNKKKKPHIPVDEDLLKESLAELNALVGLTNVKKEVNELIKLVRFYQEEGKDVMNKFPLHSVFTGNPGTGKTTVARILAKIFKAVGIIERGDLIECDREKLVGAFVGQTAIKTNEMIDKAQGSVLFIDEAYSLTSGHGGDFGNEAIDTLLKRMEDKRGEFIVIVAGYTDRMVSFLESNPGLRSRFDRKFDFEDYNAEELETIFINMITQEGMTMDKKSAEFMTDYLKRLVRQKSKYFGNGRAIRKVVEKTIKSQNLRLAELPIDKRTDKLKKTITLDDVKNFDPTKDDFLESGKGVRIGF
jgi:SpoVK/Ycf46/Vps4 family AAA+-type ATPase